MQVKSLLTAFGGLLTAGAALTGSAAEPYVQSDGTQAILTDYRATDTTCLEVEYEYVAVEANKYVCGARGDTDGGASTMKLNCCVGHQGSKAVMYAFHVNKNNRWFGSTVHKTGDRVRVVIDAPNDKAYKELNGSVAYENTISDYAGGSFVGLTAAYPLAVFANNKNGTLEGYSKIKLFSLKLYTDGALVRDYRPYLLDGKAGLKDAVTGQFHAPVAGTLAYGGDIESGTRPTAYLQSTGSSYLDLNYYPTRNTTVEMDFEMVETSNVTQPGLIGANGPMWHLMYLNGSKQYAFNLRADWATGGVGCNTSTGIAGDIGVRRTFRLDGWGRNAGLWKNGETEYFEHLTAGQTNEACTSSFLLFSRQGWSSQYAKMKLYGLKILEAGELVHDYMPCTKEQKPGLWDKVGKTFLPYASGSVGGDVSEIGDAYLESDGTQAILTDYKAKPTTKMVADFEYVESKGGIYIAGARSYDKTTAGLSCAFYHQDAGYLAWSFHENGGNRWYGSTKPVTGKRYVTMIDYPNDWAEYWIDGVSTYSQKMSDYTSGVTKEGLYPLAVFANNNCGSIERFSKIRLHSLKCWENGVLVRQFLPYKSGDKVGLFDTVTKKAFLNSVSGANVLGYGGKGCDGSGSPNLLVAPADCRAKGGFVKMQAFAPGAVSYRWFADGVEIAGATEAELVETQEPTRGKVTYTVKPVFVINGNSVEGEAASAVGDHTKFGLAIIFR